METLAFKDLSFTYPGAASPALENIDLTVEEGEFITLCGSTGSGKSTLLRLAKPGLEPVGELKGSVRLFGADASTLTQRESASRIGFVSQDPDMQIVTHKVWHELAFLGENLGQPEERIRRRVCEIADFFGISDLFERPVEELSGGQKQILNLAAAMAGDPELLLLDEPTSMLDPVAAQDFTDRLVKLNRELSVTVVVCEHRLEEFFCVSDRVAALHAGRLICLDTPRVAVKTLAQGPCSRLIPVPAAVFAALEGKGEAPLSVREGRRFISENYKNSVRSLPKPPETERGEPAMEMKNVRFRFERQQPDVLDGLDLTVRVGEIFCLHGSNGSGKSTALLCAAGIRRPHSGKVKLFGKAPSEYKSALYDGVVSLLPQDVTECFLYSTVSEELKNCPHGIELSGIDLSDLGDRHPYDLSGGQKQLLALAKALEKKPRLLLLDEPTKGLDNLRKDVLADVLKNLRDKGVTVVCVTHDLEFSAAVADRCALMFRGRLVCCESPRDFFDGGRFYTTCASRMTRGRYEGVVTAADCVALCRANGEKK